MITQRILKTEDYKPGDKVTIEGIGIAYIKEILPDNEGYYIYIVNKKVAGGGWQDSDFKRGWVRV